MRDLWNELDQVLAAAILVGIVVGTVVLVHGCAAPRAVDAVRCQHAFWQDERGGDRPFVYSQQCGDQPWQEVCRSSKRLPNEECP